MTMSEVSNPLIQMQNPVGRGSPTPDVVDLTGARVIDVPIPQEGLMVRMV